MTTQATGSWPRPVPNRGDNGMRRQGLEHKRQVAGRRGSGPGPGRIALGAHCGAARREVMDAREIASAFVLSGPAGRADVLVHEADASPKAVPGRRFARPLDDGARAPRGKEPSASPVEEHRRGPVANHPQRSLPSPGAPTGLRTLERRRGNGDGPACSLRRAPGERLGTSRRGPTWPPARSTTRRPGLRAGTRAPDRHIGSAGGRAGSVWPSLRPESRGVDEPD